MLEEREHALARRVKVRLHFFECSNYRRRCGARGVGVARRRVVRVRLAAEGYSAGMIHVACAYAACACACTCLRTRTSITVGVSRSASADARGAERARREHTAHTGVWCWVCASVCTRALWCGCGGAALCAHVSLIICFQNMPLAIESIATQLQRALSPAAFVDALLCGEWRALAAVCWHVHVLHLFECCVNARVFNMLTHSCVRWYHLASRARRSGAPPTDGACAAYVHVCGCVAQLAHRFVLKSLPSGEEALFRSLLPSYVLHARAEPHTLLARYCGHFRLVSVSAFVCVRAHHRVCVIVVRTQVRAASHTFIVMANVFGAPINEQFDLKGSSVNRYVQLMCVCVCVCVRANVCSHARSRVGTSDADTARKDEDFVGRSLCVGGARRGALLSQVCIGVVLSAHAGVFSWSVIARGSSDTHCATTACSSVYVTPRRRIGTLLQLLAVVVVVVVLLQVVHQL
jgi:hypothetical protein